MKAKFLYAITGIAAAALVFAPPASAHVAVTPKTALPAEGVLFSVSVPNEEEVAVTEVKVLIPAGVKSASPTVHPGWTIETAKDGEEVTGITWKGGEIPGGQRDDFTFRAQTPAAAGELQWKAYQTYADGKTVAWDQKPAAEGRGTESADSGPYSVTQVSDAAGTDDSSPVSTSGTASIALGISLVALILSLVTFLGYRKRG